MKKFGLAGIAIATMMGVYFPVQVQAEAATQITKKQVIEHYTLLVSANYTDAYQDAKSLQKAIDAFLKTPSQKTLDAAKKAWLVSRDSYSQTEAFRFYEGPIDFVDQNTGEEGPEGRLNAWPLNEAYIDYVEGNDKAGLVNNAAFTISKDALKEKNQAEDEADVATGYHAIEFLLWGQDLSAEGPGNRSYQDFVAGEGNNDRRREYLRVTTELLVEDLKFLVDQWKAGDAYAKEFTDQDSKVALGKILTSLATLSGFELASERMATALDSGDQEDEHSCFSDNTHADFVMNAKGIENVYFGHYKSLKGASIHALLHKKDAELAEKLEAQLKETAVLIAGLPKPVDQKILATVAGSEARAQMEAVIASLQKQADLFKKAGEVLGVQVEVQTG